MLGEATLSPLRNDQPATRYGQAAICPRVQHLCTPPREPSCVQTPWGPALLHVSWGWVMTNVSQLDFGVAGVSREIQAGAGSLPGGTYFKLDQG